MNDHLSAPFTLHKGLGSAALFIQSAIIAFITLRHGVRTADDTGPLHKDAATWFRAIKAYIRFFGQRAARVVSGSIKTVVELFVAVVIEAASTSDIYIYRALYVRC